MKESILIHRIAKFLLINSEVVKSTTPSGKTPLLYFLFSYAKTFEKEPYSDFTFDQLKKSIAQEYRRIGKVSHNFESSPVAMGSALMHFTEQGFFESDDLDNLLQRFDTVAFFLSEHSKGNSSRRESMEKTLLLSEYFGQRIATLVADKGNNQKMNEYLVYLSEKLLNDLSFQKHLDISLLLRCQHFFKSITQIEGLQQYSKKGLDYLWSFEVLKPDVIREDYIRSIRSKNFNKQIQYVVWFPHVFKDVVDYSKLERLVTKEAERLMKNLYVTKYNDVEYYMLRLTLIGIFLLEKETLKPNRFLQKIIGSL